MPSESRGIENAAPPGECGALAVVNAAYFIATQAGASLVAIESVGMDALGQSLAERRRRRPTVLEVVRSASVVDAGAHSRFDPRACRLDLHPRACGVARTPPNRPPTRCWLSWLTGSLVVASLTAPFRPSRLSRGPASRCRLAWAQRGPASTVAVLASSRERERAGFGRACRARTGVFRDALVVAAPVSSGACRWFSARKVRGCFLGGTALALRRALACLGRFAPGTGFDW